MLLRMIAILGLLSCVTENNGEIKIRENNVNRASMKFEIDAVLYDGVGVVKRRPGVGIKIKYYLPYKTELLIIDNCSRHKIEVRPKEDTFYYHYQPFIWKEQEDSCVLRANAINYKGETTTALIDFTDSRRLKAEVYCNGEAKEHTGVALCQNHAGKINWIDFDDVVIAESAKGCPEIQSADRGYGKRYEFKMGLGFCVYGFINQKKERFRLTTYGYNQIDEVLIRR